MAYRTLKFELNILNLLISSYFLVRQRMTTTLSSKHASLPTYLRKKLLLIVSLTCFHLESEGS